MPATLTNIAIPTVRVQFSADQLKPIFLGLDDLLQEANYVCATGSLRRYPNLPNEYGRYGCHEMPTEEQLASVRSAHAKIQPRLETGGWVRLDHRELAACALAVSHAKRIVRKKYVRPWRNDYKATARRLQPAIEKCRKRAIRQLPIELHRPERDKILNDLRIVRQRLAPNVQERKQRPWVRARARDLVDKAERLARVGLDMRGLESPPSVSLRTLVRAYMQNVVRRGFGRQMCLEDEISAALMLTRYVIKRSPDLVRRTVARDSGRPLIRATSVAVPKSAPAPVRETETSAPAVLRKEVPACVRLACSELEWLMIEDLDGKSAWSKMSRPALVAAIAKAKKDGQGHLSNRRIGRILGVDDKTVGRMLKEAALPKEVHTQILRGNKSGNQALNEARDPAYQQAMRLGRERKDGSVSDMHAKQIVNLGSLGWCARQVISSAKELILQAPWERLRGHVPETNIHQAIAASKMAKLNTDRDDPGRDADALRLCYWLLRVAPEQEICTAALDKALKEVPNLEAWGRVS
jgi:hypothetical protein